MIAGVSSMRAERPSVAYQIGLALVTLAMVLLPCLYVAMAGLVTWGVWYFATHYFVAIWEWPIGHNRLSFLVQILCSCTPLLVGGAIAIAMVKPLFARRASQMQPLALDPNVEPRVFALVQEVCAVVGAPAPRRIELNCEVNASASFERGLLGFLGRQRLILTLGLPLVAGLSTRELAGVIAHEFGHFRQAAGMRLSYLIRRVNGWFARVVYERDTWDAVLESWCEADEKWIAFMVGCARLGVAVSRGVLWLLMMAGHAISSLLLRQMEFDADRAEVHVAGSAAFESTMLKLAALGSVYGEINREMARVWRKQLQLPDNLPVLLEYRVAHLPPADRAKVESVMLGEKTGVLDTHPSASDRIARARQLHQPGAALSDEPARRLFENFDTVSRLVTLAHYEDDLNVPTTPDFLIPLEQLIRAKTIEVAAAAEVKKPEPVPMMKYTWGAEGPGDAGTGGLGDGEKEGRSQRPV
jgi:Zn-dependent protease with chaperone function